MRASSVEILFLILTLCFCFVIILIPFIINRKIKGFNVFSLIAFSLFITFLLSILLTYWSESLSNDLIFKLYGFDSFDIIETQLWTDGMMNIEDQKTIEQIYHNSFGIGWPLKAMFMYIVYIVPFNFIAFGILYKKNKFSSINL